MSAKSAKIFFLAAFAIFALGKGVLFVKDVAPGIRTFARVKGDYGRLREDIVAFKTAQDVKAFLPYPSQQPVATNASGIDKMALMYALQPGEIRSDADIFLDVTGSRSFSSGDSQRVALGSRSHLYAKEGIPLNKPQFQKRPYPRFRVILGFLIYCGMNIVLGMSLIGRGPRSRLRQDPLWLAGTSYLLGFVLLTLGVWAAMLLGCPLNRLLVVGIWFGALFLCRFLIPLSRRKALFGPVRPQTSLGLWGQAAGLLLIGATLIIFLAQVSEPVWHWDSMNWNIKAKVFFYRQALHLKSPVYGYHSYPVLWPLNMAMQFAFIGGTYDEVIRWSAALCFLIFIIQMAKGLALCGVSRPMIPVLLLVMLALFFSTNPFLSGMPENAFLAMQTTLLVLMLAARQRDFSGLWTGITALLASGLALIKLEGYVSVFLLGIGLLCCGLRGAGARPRWRLIILLLLTVVLPVGWTLWVRQAGAPGLIHFREPFTFAKVWLMFKAYWHYLSVSQERLVLILVAYLIGTDHIRKRNLRPNLLLLIPFVGLFFFRAAAFSLWPQSYFLREGILHDGLWRLMWHGIPFLILFWGERDFRSKINGVRRR